MLIADWEQGLKRHHGVTKYALFLNALCVCVSCDYQVSPQRDHTQDSMYKTKGFIWPGTNIMEILML